MRALEENLHAFFPVTDFCISFICTKFDRVYFLCQARGFVFGCSLVRCVLCTRDELSKRRVEASNSSQLYRLGRPTGC